MVHEKSVLFINSNDETNRLTCKSISGSIARSKAIRGAIVLHIQLPPLQRNLIYYRRNNGQRWAVLIECLLRVSTSKLNVV